MYEVVNDQVLETDVDAPKCKQKLLTLSISRKIAILILLFFYRAIGFRPFSYGQLPLTGKIVKANNVKK